MTLTSKFAKVTMTILWPALCACAGRTRKQIDIVVAKHKFVREVVDRAEQALVAGVMVRRVRLADLVLLKLFAGGTQDKWDIDRVLASADATLIAEVESRLAVLPSDARALWERIRAER